MAESRGSPARANLSIRLVTEPTSRGPGPWPRARAVHPAVASSDVNPCLRYPTLAIRPQSSLCVDLAKEASHATSRLPTSDGSRWLLSQQPGCVLARDEETQTRAVAASPNGPSRRLGLTQVVQPATGTRPELPDWEGSVPLSWARRRLDR